MVSMILTNFNICSKCGINSASNCFKHLLTLPEYFVISFVNKEMAPINIDFNLDLSSFLYPGIKMNSLYNLFAFIYKENGEFFAVRRYNDGWCSFDNGKVIHLKNITVNQNYPYLIIYKLKL